MVHEKFAILIEIKATLVLILFLATRKQTSQKGVIKFSTDKVIANINSSDVSYLELGDKLKHLNNGNILSKLQQIGNDNTIRRRPTNKDRDGQSKWQNTKNGHGRVSKKPRFQDNNAIKVKYTTTRIKSRNFLSNIAGMYA